MKCSEVKNLMQNLIDNEIDQSAKIEIESHFASCNLCNSDFQTLQQTQILLKKQPQIFPSRAFDNRVLQAFENRKVVETEHSKSWFAGLFAIPKPAFAFGIILLLLATATAFFIGRNSVKPTVETTIVEKIVEKEIAPKVSPKNEEVATATPEIRTVTKIVQVPVVKEKIVERIVYITKPNQKEGIENNKIKNPPTIAQNDNIANQFNLKNLQPVMNVTYQIIKKGENNE